MLIDFSRYGRSATRTIKAHYCRASDGSVREAFTASPSILPPQIFCFSYAATGIAENGEE